MFLIFALIYLCMIALMLWVGYLVIRTAVKNGILRADAECAARYTAASVGPPSGGPAGPPAPPVR